MKKYFASVGLHTFLQSLILNESTVKKIHLKTTTAPNITRCVREKAVPLHELSFIMMMNNSC
jgi:hypothetical protein